VKIHVCTVIKNGTTKAILRTIDELRIYVVAAAPLPHGPPPGPGPSERWSQAAPRIASARQNLLNRPDPSLRR